MAKIKLDGGYNALPISYKRGNPIPLDTTSVWYNLTDLETYAKEGVTAYVGQVLTLVEDNKTTVFVIADEAGSLEPVGTTPIGDDKSIVVDEDTSTISLKGIDTLNFERDILGEDGQPTGDKESIQYQPLMTSTGLVWIEPSKTTVEGLATLIEGLTVRMTGVEGRTTTLETDLAGETARATAAEEALGGRIDDVNTALADYAKTAEVDKTLEDYAKTAEVDKTLEAYAKTADVDKTLASYTTTEALNGLLAAKADKSAYDETVSTLAALKARVEAFLDDTGTIEDTLDSLQELIAYIDSHDDADIAGILASIQKIEAKLDGIEDGKTVVDFVDAEIKKLEINTYAKAEALNALAAKVDVDSVSGAIATAKQGAIDEAKADAKDKADAAEGAAKSYADGKITEALATAATDAKDKADAAEAAAKADAAEKLAAAMATVYTKTEIDTTVSDINSAIALKANAADVYTKEDIDGKTFASKTEVETAVAAEAKRADEAEKAISAEVATIKADYTTKAEKATLEQGITDAKALGNQGIADAADAAAKATSNAIEITAIKARLDVAEPQIAENTGNITALGTRVGATEASIKEINETALPSKADKSVVEGLSATVGTNTADIAGLKTADAEISAQIALKADSSVVYTKSEVDGTVATLTNAIGEAKTEATNAVNALANGAVATNTANLAIVQGDENTSGSIAHAVKVEKDRALAAEAELDTRLDNIEMFFDAEINTKDFVDTLKEIQDYITSDLAAADLLTKKVGANEEAVKDHATRLAAAETAISTGLPGAIAEALAGAKSYTDTEIAKVVADEVSITKTVAEDGTKTFSVKAISTDLLVDGKDDLILFGGKA